MIVSDLIEPAVFFCLGSLFRDGTTDVTRTVHFGVPTIHQKVSYPETLFTLLFNVFIVQWVNIYIKQTV